MPVAPGRPGVPPGGEFATDTELATHAADTTAVHGITDTTDLVTLVEVAEVPPTAAHVPLQVPTYDTLPSVGHPSVVHVPAGWNGYTYWMAFTPYPTSPRENPSIVASNDGVVWVEPEGITNPVHTNAEAVSAGYDYWADVELVLTASDDLALYFKGIDTGVTNDFYLSTSSDGITWSEPAMVIEGAGPTFTIVCEGTDYTMWEVDNGLKIRTSTDGETWSAAASCTIPTLPAPYTLWHVSVCLTDGTYHCLVSGSVETGTGPYRLFHWTSTNGTTWTGDTTPSVPLSGGRFDTRGHYRSCILPAVSGAADRFDVWLSCMDETRTNHDNSIWRIGHLQDFDFRTTAETWAGWGPPTGYHTRQETGEVWVMPGEFTTYAGAPVAGPATGWPALGMRGSTASDGIAASFPPLPMEWHHVTVEALIVSTTGVGDVVLSTRHDFTGPGTTLSTGTFRSVTGGTTVEATPTWLDVVGVAQETNDPLPVELGRPLKISIERSYGNANDTLEDTCWVLAFRVRRIRDP